MSKIYNIIDVSEFQAPKGQHIDWEKVKNSGIDGAIIKFGAGPKLVDSEFDYNVKECIRLGLHVGAYIYSWATTAKEAEYEADRLIEACSKYNLDMPLYYDIEEGTINKRTGTAQLTTEAFLNKCKEKGITAGVYSGLYWFIHYLYPSRMLEHPLWIAQYKNGITRPEHPHPEWFGMFQYTSKGSVDGIVGNVDMNYCYVPYWETYGKKDPVAPAMNFVELDGALLQLQMKLKEATDALTVVGNYYDSVKSKYSDIRNALDKAIEDNKPQDNNTETPAPTPETPQPTPEPQKPVATILSMSQRQLFLRTFFYYYKGNIDGIDGPQTQAAVKAYQAGQGLSADGLWGDNTQKASESNARAVQQKLCDAGMKTDIDGIIGNDTIACLTRYQTAVGLTADGIMGVETYRKLFNDPSYGAATTTRNTGGISAHFNKTEFRCGCGGRYCNGYNGKEVSTSLLNILEKLRSYYGRPIVITSGIRCQKYNDSLRGSIKTSAHIQGKAADIYIRGITDSASGRAQVKRLAYQYGAKYCYYGTSNMGNAVHINV